MKKENIFWGLFLIVAAVFIITNRLGLGLGVLAGVSVFQLIVGVFLVAGFIKSLFTLEFPGMFFSAAFFIWLFDAELGLEAITPWTVLGAALLLSIGCSILFPRHHFHHHHHIGYSGSFDPDDAKDYHDPEDKEHFSTVENKTDGEEIYFRTTFSSGMKYINSDNFKKATLDASFGAMKLYFDNAIIQGESAVIDIDASFAGIELYIPKDWKVQNNVASSFGAVEEKNRSNADASHTVYLQGKSSFAGITILYV